MSPLLWRIIQTRCGGRVQRAHVLPHSGEYSVGEHSWGVAMLMYALWPAHFQRLAIYCLAHDVPEAWTGDVPGPALSMVGEQAQGYMEELEEALQGALGLPSPSELPKEDQARLKACDRLELYIWCREQLLRGNQFAGHFLKELRKLFAEQPLPYKAARLYDALERLEDDALLGDMSIRGTLGPLWRGIMDEKETE